MRRRRSSVQRFTWVWPMRQVRPLFIDGAERDLVDEPAIDARNRERAGRAADIDHLAQHMRPVALGHHRLLDAIVHGIDVARDVGLHADAIDALLRALATGELLQALDDALLVEVDGDRRRRPRAMSRRSGTRSIAITCLAPSSTALADRHLPDGSGAPDRDRVRRARCRTGPRPASRSGRCRRGTGPARR